jgi:microcystin-dependent protein
VADPFLSEIRIMSFGYAPRGWALCNGQLLPINQNQALFSLLGTTYGGDGRVNFALPDLRGRAQLHFGSSHTLGETSGQQAHTVSISELPAHAHTLQASSTTGNAPVTTANVLAANPSALYHAAVDLDAMSPATVTSVGGSQAHLNMQPFLTLSFCIALVGIFPSPN